MRARRARSSTAHGAMTTKKNKMATIRGCTLAGDFNFLKGRKLVILGVSAAPGAWETLHKGGGLHPPTFLESFRGSRGRSDPKMTDFQSSKFPTMLDQAKVQPRGGGYRFR